MAPQDSPSAALSEENRYKSIQALISPPTNSILKVRGDSKILRPLTVTVTAVPQLPHVPLPM
jgi:hypothetical protein